MRVSEVLNDEFLMFLCDVMTEGGMEVGSDDVISNYRELQKVWLLVAFGVVA